MLRSRGIAVRPILAVETGGATERRKRRKKQSFQKWFHNVVTTTPTVMIVKRVVSIYILFSIGRFGWLLVKNTRGGVRVSNNRNGPPTLRGKSSVITNQTSPLAFCPELPERLQNLPPESRLHPMTQNKLTEQLEYKMEAVDLGTTGNRILKCKNQYRGISCRGVLKIYPQRSVYELVKRCLTLLEHAQIAPRILYADDATATMVEEDLGTITMMNSPIPMDFDLQLRRIRCILREHAILHRDLLFRNFIIDKKTGKVFVIDFGDAFVWEGGGVWNSQNFSSRNLVNLFNMWWRGHDEDANLEWLIDYTKPEIRGDRQWRPPQEKHHWTSLNQNRMGALLLPNQVSGNTDNMQNTQKEEPKLKIPDQWKKIMPGFVGKKKESD